MVHTTLQAMPMQFKFGQDAILNIHYNANWRYITTYKQKLINQNNIKESSSRIPYSYQKCQQVLTKADQSTKCESDAYLGLYTIEHVDKNGMVGVNEGAVADTYSIHNLTLYKI